MNLIDNQQVVLSAQATDDQGNAVPNPGVLSAVSSDESVITVTDNGDGTFTAVTTGVLGAATVTVSDDVDADGFGDFVGSLAFDVVAGNVAAIAVTAGTPTTRV